MAASEEYTDTMTLKIAELMKEVQLDYSPTTTKAIDDTISSIKKCIKKIPEDLHVKADLAPKFIKDIGADKVEFKFKRPKSIEVGGSYSFQCVVKPDVHVDLYVRLPKKCFHEKDFLNHRYHGKRCLYLCVIKKYLESSSIAEKVEWSFFQNEARKPILVVYPVVKPAGLPEFSVRLIPTADSLFNVQKLNIERNNLHVSSQGDSEATPVYNNSILEDMFIEQGSEFVTKAFNGWKSLQEALVLLKVWARQRSSLHTYDCLNGYLLSILMAYLASESGKFRINKAMTTMQIFRITLDFMATSKLWGTGIFFKPQGEDDMSKEERKRYAAYFPAVICDLSAHFNLAYRMTKNGLTELQNEAALALKCIDKCKEGGFVELFMTKLDFPAKFDYCMRLNLKGKVEVCGQDNESWRLYEKKLHSLLQEGLGDRAKFVRVTWRNTSSTHSINDGLSVLDKEPLMVGISISLPEAFDEYTRGPFFGDKAEALKFRKFWGDRAELYQFKSGTRECVLWKCKPAKRYIIIKWVTEYVLTRHLSLTPENIMHAVDQLDFSLVHDNEDTGFQGSLLESFGTLSKRLRLLSEVPLAISSVQPLDSAFRHTSVFPPKPHPLANGTKVGNKITSTCIPSLEVMIQLEGSGNWPMDNVAIEKTKSAFLLRIGECLQKDYGMRYCPSEEGVDVFMSGYVFRLKILHERGLNLLNGQAESYQVKRVSPTDKLLFLRSQHSSMINGLAGRYPLYGPVVQLAKRWVAAHMFSASFREEAIELVVASVFQNSLPFSAPCSRISGFMRFLRLLSQHDWMFTPLIVDINEDMTPDDEKEIDEKFSVTRKAYEEGTGSVTSAMYLATAYDKASETWTASSPTVSELKRLAVYAKSSSNLLAKLITQGQLDSYGWECIFRTPLNNYDAVILVHREKLSYPERLLFPSDLNHGKLVAQGKASKSFESLLLPKVKTKVSEDQLYINFDPLKCYIKHLESAFPDKFKLWYDSLGGDAIGLTWEKDNSKKRRREEDDDVAETLKDIGRVGKGFVKSVYLLKEPRH